MGTFKDNKNISMLDMIKSLSFKTVNGMIVYFKTYNYQTYTLFF